MATLAKIMRARKLALNAIFGRMRMLDSAQEEVERFIRRLIKRKNKLPTTKELGKIVRACNLLDKLLDNIVKVTETSVDIFKNSADVESEPNMARIEGLKPSDINKWAKSLQEFLSDLSSQIPTSGLGAGGEVQNRSS